jgi:hypothetical protein
MSAFLTFLLANLPLIIKFLSLLLGIGGVTATHMTASSWAGEGVEMTDLQYFGVGGGSVLSGLLILLTGFGFDAPTTQILADHREACASREQLAKQVAKQRADQLQAVQLSGEIDLLPLNHRSTLSSQLGSRMAGGQS